MKRFVEHENLSGAVEFNYQETTTFYLDSEPIVYKTLKLWVRDSSEFPDWMESAWRLGVKVEIVYAEPHPTSNIKSRRCFVFTPSREAFETKFARGNGVVYEMQGELRDGTLAFKPDRKILAVVTAEDRVIFGS